jgi:hypothetical protein
MLAVEEPLEIRLEYGAGRARTRRSITVTMRTPGSDVELAVGFLFAEGLVRRPEDIEGAASCGLPAGPPTCGPHPCSVGFVAADRSARALTGRHGRHHLRGVLHPGTRQ